VGVILFAVLASTGGETKTASNPVTRGSNPPTRLVVVFGAPGEPEFGANFAAQLDLWKQLSEKAGCSMTVIGNPDERPPEGEADTEPPAPNPATEATGPAIIHDRQKLRECLEAAPREDRAELWLILIGHGTFDGKEAHFNLWGPDVTATEMAEWLGPFQRPLAIVNTTSSSAPFLPKLAATNRVVITATRSGHELNFARFGLHFVQAMLDPASDLDHDGQTSLLEGFLSASYRVADFYKTEGRLATEHSLIDDNGDGLGTPADWFRGLRATKKARDNAQLDGLRAHQFHLIRSEAENALSPEVRARRDELERAIAHLRETRQDATDEDQYYADLEKLLLDLARLYQQATPKTE
jgi:hypothetical protein